MTAVQNLNPSTLRTSVLDACGGIIAPVYWCPKASADCLDYTLDFSSVLAGTGDTLASIQSATVKTAQGATYDLAIMWSAVAGSLATFFLASGQPGAQQRLLIEIGTAQGRVYSVPVMIQITTVTAATAPPSDFPTDTLTNGKVLIAGVEALPAGYSSNGRVVVVAAQVDGPVGAPSFESVTSNSYAGDGSGLDVTVAGKAQTLAEWLAAGGSGSAGAGIKSVDATQGAVMAGEPSTVTLTSTLTDGSTSETTFESPPGSVGLTGDSAYQSAVAAGFDGTEAAWLASLVGKSGASVTSITATQGTPTAGQPSTVTLKSTLSDDSSTETTFQAPPGATGVGTPGVGVSGVQASQEAVTVGQSTTVTLTTKMTDGTSSTTTFEVPAGANGSDATVTPASIESALGYVPAAPLLKPYVYTDNTPNRITVDMGGGLYGDLNNSSTSWNYWYMPATAPNGWNILVYTGPKDTSIKYADNSANIINGSDIAYNKIVKVINIGAEENPIWICG